MYLRSPKLQCTIYKTFCRDRHGRETLRNESIGISSSHIRREAAMRLSDNYDNAPTSFVMLLSPSADGVLSLDEN